MNMIEYYPLQSLNTFKVPAVARYFCIIRQETDLADLQQWCHTRPECPVLWLGQGSNILFAGDYPGLVVQIALQQRRIIQQDHQFAYLQAGAGENWHQFVRWSIDQGFAGLENLSLIPGTVGAAPIQNIGAYGVELKDVFYGLQALHRQTGEWRFFNLEQCEFAYRDSFFKKPGNQDWVITAVTLRLPLTPQWQTDYAGVREQLAGQEPTARLISDAIICLRQSKLADPAQLGNAGSFFKNPLISPKQHQRLQEQYPNLPGWTVNDRQVKVSAAWLIEQCGWKGQRNGDAGIYEKHALVLVNHGAATGEQIVALAQSIMGSVAEKYGIKLEPEPRIISH